MTKRHLRAGGALALRVAALVVVVLAVAAMVCPPLAVHAAGSTVHRVDVTVDLNDDGSGLVTEVWDLTASDDITEWYINKLDYDEQAITGFRVWEGDVAFADEGEWDVQRTREQKAQKSGVVTRSNGYELCWGIGSAGRHVFTIQYTLSNMVKSFQESDAIYIQKFISQVEGGVGEASVTIRRPGLEMREENTGVWAGGGAYGDIWVRDGQIVCETSRRMASSDELVIMVEFAKGMFHPLVQRSDSFLALRDQVLDGSGYIEDEPATNVGGGNGATTVFSVIGRIFPVLFGGVFFVAIIGVITSVAKHGAGSGTLGHMKKEYKEAPYSRELPYSGQLAATYARLKELNQLPGGDGAIIGTYLLKWISTRQVELAIQQGGVFKNKDETAIKLYQARSDMEPNERSLYEMLVRAAGSDYVLQSKEFEKWSRKNYEKVEGWLGGYKNTGHQQMRQMGALAQEPTKVFFGLVSTTKSVVTPYGEQLTVDMFGFKKYLQDFTIINERQAREVELWQQYLIFAQLFGIAETVAEQFKQLYPDFFTQMATNLGYGGRMDWFDFYMITRISQSYGRAMQTGYRAGYNAAHSSSYSGGGGSFGGGGGGFSGGGGGGGAGGR